MTTWDGTKRDKRKETGLVEEVINFSKAGGGTSLVTDSTKIGSIISVLKNFKNPYIGNKRKLIPHLINVIEKYGIKYNTVLDLFSGSAFVSMAMKMLDKKVVSNDLLSCSYLNAVAFVKNKDVTLSQEEKDCLFLEGEQSKIYIDDKYLNRLDNIEISIISQYYQNVYDKWGHPFDGNMKAVLAIAYMQNYVIENCFVGGRLNNGQILASYDHRIDHPRNKGLNMFFNGRDISYSNMGWPIPIYPTDLNSHECYNMDAIELLSSIKPDVDLAYIDPPYGGSQSDYGFMYALFEEMLYGCSYKKIEAERSGTDRFIDKNNYKDNFNELLDLSRYIPNIIISYNDTSWGKIDEIYDIVKQHRNNVEVEEFSYSYKYRNQKNNKGTREYAIIVKE